MEVRTSSNRGACMTSASGNLSKAAVDSIRTLSREALRFKPSVDILGGWILRLESEPENRFPGFDPLDAPSMLSHVYLLENDGGRLRYRVSGEAVNDLFGSNHGGKYIDEVIAAALITTVEPFYRDVLRGAVCIFKGKVIISPWSNAEFERVLLPVSRDGCVQILGTLSVSTTAPLRTEGPLPPETREGYHFTQIDPVTGAVRKTSIPHEDLPIDQLPYETHLKKFSQGSRV